LPRFAASFATHPIIVLVTIGFAPSARVVVMKVSPPSPGVLLE